MLKLSVCLPWATGPHQGHRIGPAPGEDYQDHGNSRDRADEDARYRP